MARARSKEISRNRGRVVARRSGGASRGRGWGGWGWAGRGALAALVAFAGYAAWLDFTVRARFSGETWALPARIYARPLELYPGEVLDGASLRAELAAADYHPVSRVRRSGSYASAGERFEIATRGFTFWDGAEPPRRLTVRLSGGIVSSLSEGGRAVALARLDPALVGRIYPGHREDRILVKLDDVPQVLVDGLVAVEDRRFYTHHGVSPRAIVRALWANLRAGHTVQGGSTLTQQLAKNLYLSGERSLWRKVNEAFMALLLDLRYSKEAILEAYLNEVYLGQEGSRAIHGFGLAAWFYFGRRIDELDVEECALLIGLVRGASLYNPRRQPERARKRRDLVLDIMVSQGVISARRAAAAKAAPLGVVRAVPRGRTAHPAYVDLVRAQLARDYRDADLRTEGLRIFTALEPLAQARAEQALAEKLSEVERRHGVAQGSLQGAVVLVRPASGEVVAVVGDRDPRAFGFNRAVKAVRPIGSLVKPAVYLTALEGDRGYHLMTPLVDAPLTLKVRGQPPWSPRNYDHRFGGELPLVSALAHSVNVATVRLGLDVGLANIVQTLHRLGVERPVPELPSMLLGTLALTPLEVAQMYQSIANDGFRTPLRAIREVTDAEGRPLSRYGLQMSKAATPQGVYLLRIALARVLTEGTARWARDRVSPGQRFAGKTGTTDDLRDSWFAGFNDALLGVVWIGRDDDRPTKLTGATGALRIWAEVVPPLAGQAVEGARVPPGIEWHWSSADGRAVTAAQCPAAFPMPYRSDTVPRFEPCESLTSQGQGGTRDDPVAPVRDADAG